ncbi:putative aminotransferase [Planoprotostelium fungivorum]|uniref:kynurenine--oxoglutarate transaminase n=1 Tax=Planoprotostelium fungivorum TaxID=1890364 RepID=A0A2P6MWZ3_9EUKA|nr:putative aminotransferase [Planoprotostelium fungivorum]
MLPNRDSALQTSAIRKMTTVSETITKKPLAQRLNHLSAQSVWTEFTPLANQYSAINLGQGFPDFPADKFIIDAASNAVLNHLNQYTRSMGHVRLVNALAAHFSDQFGRHIDPLKEVVVLMGATEALYATIQAIVNPGDEVILIEPFYDSYPVDIVLAGGTPKYVPLRYEGGENSSDFTLNFQELEAAITSKTKAIMINTPQNIPGKVYSRQELEKIAEIVKRHDLLLISDEVYEPMVYDQSTHVKPASLPDMFERTITIGSAGKSFSVTGWKTGWVIAPPHLSEAIWIVHQNVAFTANTPSQEAIAVGFERIKKEDPDYFKNLSKDFQKKRDLLCDRLRSAGLNPIVPQGSYFVLADISRVDEKHYFDEKSGVARDYQFARWLVKEIGVAAIPPSAFYSRDNAHLVENFVRFCFCKKEETIRSAGERLQKLKEYLK